MGHRTLTTMLVAALILLGAVPVLRAVDGGWTLVGWNDLGMHCMDADFSVLSILPPYNNLHAQLIDPSGRLVTDPTGITVTFEAVPDPSGSINSTSVGKTNFWDWVAALFGVSLAPDSGLAGSSMPGAANTPQAMEFNPTFAWFAAEGVPITPYDDASRKNYYPVMRLVARDAAGQILATTRVVLPVSDEMTCISCHGSGSGPAAMPSGGWANANDPEVDYRLNILLIHDDLQGGDPAFTAALAAAGYSPLGLYATVTGESTPVLCAACHGSNALPGLGQTGISPLTRAIHSGHANVVDPSSGMTLDSSENRAACYTCHPGSETRCLRGAMGVAVAADGSLAMQCQSCHGGMSRVGAVAREGWFDEPVCQSCHTGTAMANNGQIRYTSVFDDLGDERVAVDHTFATDPDTPMPGVSLFRFSTGHGGLQCEACHGSTHAIFPTSHENDNLQSLDLQGHVGTLVECETCHGTQPQTLNGGPHGMHPVGQWWVTEHHDYFNHDPEPCRACHGADLRGTVLSRSHADRTVSSELGTIEMWRGFQVSCYACHNGPSSSNRTPNHAPVVDDVTAATSIGGAVAIPLAATDPDGNSLSLRVVSQAANGTVGLVGSTATYFPFDGFSGTDSFTFAAWDGSIDSNLGVATISVGGGPVCTVSCSADVPASGVEGSAVQLTGSANTFDCAGGPAFAWDFGDGSSGAGASVSHVYALPGTYTWTLTVSAGGSSCSRSGSITIASAPPQCVLQCSAEVPSRGSTRQPTEFHGAAEGAGCSGAAAFSWSFGDGGSATGAEVGHQYTSPGTYTWTMEAAIGDASCSTSGAIRVTGRENRLSTSGS